MDRQRLFTSMGMRLVVNNGKSSLEPLDEPGADHPTPPVTATVKAGTPDA